MAKDSGGRIKNNWGIVNFGEIHGNVTSHIRGRLEHAQGQSAPSAEILKTLLALADEIGTHAKAVDDPEDALKKVEELTAEVDAPKPSQSTIDRCLGFLALALGRLPPLLERVLSIKTLVKELIR
jgi:hypothetical protein